MERIFKNYALTLAVILLSCAKTDMPSLYGNCFINCVIQDTNPNSFKVFEEKKIAVLLTNNSTKSLVIPTNLSPDYPQRLKNEFRFEIEIYNNEKWKRLIKNKDIDYLFYEIEFDTINKGEKIQYLRDLEMEHNLTYGKYRTRALFYIEDLDSICKPIKSNWFYFIVR